MSGDLESALRNCKKSPRGISLEPAAQTDAKEYQCRHNIDPVTGVKFSPDGAILATCSYDGITRLWSVATGACLRTIVLGSGGGSLGEGGGGGGEGGEGGGGDAAGGDAAPTQPAVIPGFVGNAVDDVAALADGVVINGGAGWGDGAVRNAPIGCIVPSPNGRYLLASTLDAAGSLRLWDAVKVLSRIVEDVKTLDADATDDDVRHHLDRLQRAINREYNSGQVPVVFCLVLMCFVHCSAARQVKMHTARAQYLMESMRRKGSTTSQGSSLSSESGRPRSSRHSSGGRSGSGQSSDGSSERARGSNRADRMPNEIAVDRAQLSAAELAKEYAASAQRAATLGPLAGLADVAHAAGRPSAVTCDTSISPASLSRSLRVTCSLS